MDNKTSAAFTRLNARNCTWRLNVMESLAADIIKLEMLTEEEVKTRSQLH